MPAVETAGVEDHHAGSVRPPERVIVGGVVLAAVVVTVQEVANLVDFGVYHYRFAFVNPNNESSLFAWIGGVVILFAAFLCFLHSRHSRSERGRYLLSGLALAVIGLENRVRYHEGTVHRAIIYVPLLGAMFTGLVWTSWRWPGAARRVVWTGLSSLVLSFALHKVAPHLLAHFGYGSGDWPYEVKVSLKESSELCGWILIATALLAGPREELVRRRHEGRDGEARLARRRDDRSSARPGV